MKNKTRWVRLMESIFVVGICAGYSSATSLPTQGTDAMEAAKPAASSAEPERQGHGKVLRFGVHVSEMGTLVEQIIEFKPTQKTVIASGFSETERVKEAQRLGAGKYIKKPYTLETIGIIIKEELEK